MGLFFILASSSCEKDNLSNTELLTSHVWKWDKMTTTSTNENLLALVAFANALMTGATMDFHEDGTYTITGMNNYSDDGDWMLNDADSKLITDTYDEMSLIKLTKDELVLQGEVVDDEYGSYSVTLYFKK